MQDGSQPRRPKSAFLCFLAHYRHGLISWFLSVEHEGVVDQEPTVPFLSPSKRLCRSIWGVGKQVGTPSELDRICSKPFPSFHNHKLSFHFFTRKRHMEGSLISAISAPKLEGSGGKWTGKNSSPTSRSQMNRRGPGLPTWPAKIHPRE